MATGVYSTIYDLVASALFAGDPTTATYGVLICEGFSSIASVLMLCVPFIIIWRIIRRFL